MKIDRHTKISALIRSNKDVVETIVSISKNFEKLRNPVFRKVLASRITIEDAAGIGGVSVNVFFEKLCVLGFDCAIADNSTATLPTDIPEFYKDLAAEGTEVLDINDDVAQGRDPLSRILERLSRMSEKKVLKLVTSFEPAPLIRLLAKKGYESHVVCIGTEEFNTFFRLQPSHVLALNSGSYEHTATSEDEMYRIITEYEHRIIRIDVRDLEMPLPMLTILNEMELLPNEALLHITHKRIPVHLFDQISLNDFEYFMREVGEEEVNILIRRRWRD